MSNLRQNPLVAIRTTSELRPGDFNERKRGRFKMKVPRPNVPSMVPNTEHPIVPLDTSQFGAYENVEKAIDQLVETKNRRFRASIYVDIFVPETDLEKDREEARKQVEEYSSQIPNSYVGGVAEYNPHRREPLDREL